MSRLEDILAGCRIVPVVTFRDAAQAIPTTEALCAGGIPVIEVTLRTPAGLAALRAAAGVPGITAGAGTVTTTRQVDAAVDSGAAFVVSPGLDREVVERVLDRGVVPVPGIATPTEMLAARSLGLAELKLFPASLLGGTAMVKTLTALDAAVRFVPTGGIDADAAVGYLSTPQVLAVGGSWLTPAAALQDGDFEAVTELARAAARIGSAP